MIGMTIEEAAIFFCDDESVYKNASFAESELNKKYQVIFFHQARECISAEIIIVHKVNTNENLADLLTKSLTI